MDKVLHDEKPHAQVYIDDIAVFSTTSEAHCDHIAAELTKLREAGLTANIKKCQWGKTSVEFLGYIVGQGQVKPSVCKEAAIKHFVQPITKRQLWRFLGLTGYYRRFISQFAEHSFHLTEATRKAASHHVVWNDFMYAEFCYSKNVLSDVSF